MGIEERQLLMAVNDINTAPRLSHSRMH